jgi:[lysine-biosynthesis-protein LysW]---L-2-aminoadipate ligase
MGLQRLGFDALLGRPSEALASVRPADVVIARLDVLPTLDGIEDGMRKVASLERAGISIVNTARSLRAAHDKLCTVCLLAWAGVPHVRAELVRDVAVLSQLEPPVVLKPRFGSWGQDVMRCRDREELRAAVREIRQRRWFARRGVLVEALLPVSQTDVRLIVAGGRVVGAAERRAARGEWRTNLSLGGSIRPVEPTRVTTRLALRAIAAARLDLAGVDLYPVEEDWIVLEVNGAVEFDPNYSLAGRDVYADIAEALRL